MLDRAKIWSGGNFARTRRSMTLSIFDRRDIARLDASIIGSLPGFKIEMMVANFHIVGMALVLRDRLKMSVRAVSAVGHR